MSKNDDLPPAPVATGKKKRFDVTLTLTVSVEMDEALVSEVDTDDWRSTFYQLHGPGAIAEHLAFNHVLNRVDDDEIVLLDGFARCKGLVSFDVDRDVEMEHEDVTPCPFSVMRGGRRFSCIRTAHADRRHTIRTKKGGHRFIESEMGL